MNCTSFSVMLHNSLQSRYSLGASAEPHCSTQKIKSACDTAVALSPGEGDRHTALEGLLGAGQCLQRTWHCWAPKAKQKLKLLMALLQVALWICRQLYFKLLWRTQATPPSPDYLFIMEHIKQEVYMTAVLNFFNYSFHYCYF